MRTVRWSLERRVVSVQRRTVDSLFAQAAGPCGVPAAVAQAGLMAYEDSVGAEAVPVGAARGWVDDPLPSRHLHQLAQHDYKPTTGHRAAAGGLGPPNSNTGSSVLVCIGRHRMIIG